jgi:hypothetical protein
MEKWPFGRSRHGGIFDPIAERPAAGGPPEGEAKPTHRDVFGAFAVSLIETQRVMLTIRGFSTLIGMTTRRLDIGCGMSRAILIRWKSGRGRQGP